MALKVRLFWGVKDMDYTGRNMYDPYDLGSTVFDDEFDLRPEEN